MKRPKSLAKTGAVLMMAGTGCLVSLTASQRAHAQTSMVPSTTIKNIISQAEEMTLQAKITAIDPSTRAVTLKRMSSVDGPRVVKRNLMAWRIGRVLSSSVVTVRCARSF
jgi:hypothetical protein